MNVAVLSITRDRLEYTKHCFGTLMENAGCEFDWWITDNGSQDGTTDWLLKNTDATIIAYDGNAGITPALNVMIDDALAAADYDVVVKVDNDCELLTPNTLRDVAAKSLELDAILSPHIHGLREPPRSYAHQDGVSLTHVIGGIFAAVPAGIFRDGYRHPLIPTLDGEDAILCRWYYDRGGFCGYLDGYEANHYRTTDGQHEDFPWYFERREQERLAVR